MNPIWIEPWPHITARSVIDRACRFDVLSDKPLELRCIGILLGMVGAKRLFIPDRQQDILYAARLAGVAEFNSPPYDSAYINMTSFDRTGDALAEVHRAVIPGGWIVAHGLRDSAAGRRRTTEWLLDRSLPHILIAVGSTVMTWRNH